MGKTWELIEAHRSSMPYETSVRAIARAAGVGHTTLAKWQEIKRLPEPEHLRAVARQINVPYRVLLEAALEDAGYVDARPEREGVGNSGSASITKTGNDPASTVQVGPWPEKEKAPPIPLDVAADVDHDPPRAFDDQSDAQGDD